MSQAMALGSIIAIFILVFPGTSEAKAVPLVPISDSFDIENILNLSADSFSEMLGRLKTIVDYRNQGKCPVSGNGAVTDIEDHILTVMSKSFESVIRTLLMMQDLLQDVTGHFQLNPCFEKSSLSCKSDQWQCTSGHCIAEELFCNGKRDCSDGSDESADCSIKTPSSTPPSGCGLDFTCMDGACVSRWLQCDGMMDCPDGSDEADCSGGRTISLDGDREKQLGLTMETTELPDVPKTSYATTDAPAAFYSVIESSTEDSLPSPSGSPVTSVSCNSESFFCNMRGRPICIPMSWLCNRITDCDDESDEIYCPTVPSEVEEMVRNQLSLPFEESNKFLSWKEKTKKYKAFDTSERDGQLDGKSSTRFSAFQDGQLDGQSSTRVSAFRDGQSDGQSSTRVSAFRDGHTDGQSSTRFSAFATEGSNPAVPGHEDFYFPVKFKYPVSNINVSLHYFSSFGNKDREAPLLMLMETIYLVGASREFDQVMHRELPSEIEEETFSYNYERGIGILTPHSEKGRSTFGIFLTLFKIENEVSRMALETLRQSGSSEYDLINLKFNLTVNWRRSYCNREQFFCKDEERCIPKSLQCDGKEDCRGGADENCLPIRQQGFLLGTHFIRRPLCRYDQFQCETSAACLPRTWVCDGHEDCFDGSDEMECEHTDYVIRPHIVFFKTENGTCRDGWFLCWMESREMCLPEKWRCDVIQDCSKGIDETGCRTSVVEGRRSNQNTSSNLPGHVSKWQDLQNAGDVNNFTPSSTILSTSSTTDFLTTEALEDAVSESMDPYYIFTSHGLGSEFTDDHSPFSTTKSEFVANDMNSSSPIPYSGSEVADFNLTLPTTVTESEVTDLNSISSVPYFGSGVIDFNFTLPTTVTESEVTDLNSVLTTPSLESSVTDINSQAVTTTERSALPQQRSSGNFRNKHSESFTSSTVSTIHARFTENTGESSTSTTTEVTVAARTTTNALYNKKKCQDNQFHCSVSNHCIPKPWVCDEDKDCQDGEDERGCPENDCTRKGWFRCQASGICISPDWVCDGAKDCPRGGDEENCPVYTSPLTTLSPIVTIRSNYTQPVFNGTCDTQSFRCVTTDTCITMRWRCDGEDDCPDGEDEEGCYDATAAARSPATRSRLVRQPKCQNDPAYFLCSNGASCINVSWVCDNETDCLDNSDEGQGCEMQRDGFLLVSLGRRIEAFSLDVRTSFRIHREHHGNIIGVAYDPVRRDVYWTALSQVNGGVYRKTIGNDRVPSQLFLRSNTTMEGLALDWLGRNLYIADTENKRIITCSLVTANCTTLIPDVPLPRNLQLDLIERKLYWSDAETPLIEVAGMDGRQRRQLVSERVGWPNGFALDPVLRRIYWMDGKEDTVECMEMDGSNRQIITNTSSVYPYAVALWEDRIFWTDLLRKQVLTCTKWNCEDTRMFALSSPHMAAGITVYHPSLFKEANNPCAGHPCSHLCLLSRASPGYVCACPDGMVLQEDRETCV